MAAWVLQSHLNSAMLQPKARLEVKGAPRVNDVVGQEQARGQRAHCAYQPTPERRGGLQLRSAWESDRQIKPTTRAFVMFKGRHNPKITRLALSERLQLLGFIFRSHPPTFGKITPGGFYQLFQSLSF